MPQGQIDLINAWNVVQNQWNVAVKTRWGQLANVINANNMVGAVLV
jgi:hypothetical protein